MKIPFSPPDINQDDINEVIDTLQSGWITTGPKTVKFEEELSTYSHTKHAHCVNSATAALEMVLRLFNIGEGDEVITSAYTYSASASVIHHVGAKIVLCDLAEDSFFMDEEKLAGLITDKTKAIIPIDIGGVMCDYDSLFELVESKKHLFKANGAYQEALGRVLILSDAAHSLGAVYKGQPSGSVADFTCFSFHAVKNLTTAEGGSVTWKEQPFFSSDDIKHRLKMLTLHGQSKNALEKTGPGAWEYDIEILGYKSNMTDIAASLGLSQLRRYDEMLKRRHEIAERYVKGLDSEKLSFLHHFSNDMGRTSAHLMLVFLHGKDETFRNELIIMLAERGISANVHYKPLPMFTAYRNLGFDIADFPEAYRQYQRVISLPIYSTLSDGDVDYVTNHFWECYEQLEKKTF